MNDGYFQEITRLNNELVNLQRQLTKKNVQLEQLIEKAEKATQARSDLLASMSHDIRTPMNGILGITELLLTTSLTAEQREYLEMVKYSGDFLLNLVNAILDLSKIEAGKIELEYHQINLSVLLSKMTKLFNIEAANKEINLSYEIDASVPPIIMGDSQRLGQVLTNLLGNAVKFTDGGEIKLKVGLDSSLETKTLLHFTVSDTGIGIKSDSLQLVFQSFSRTDEALNKGYPGTGLGLAICKQIVNQMDGQIWVESQPGKGSVFNFTIPLLQKSSELVNVSPRVLVVEENLINQKLISTFLHRRAVQFNLAANWEDISEALAKYDYELVLMDIDIGTSNDFLYIQRIRNLEETRGKVRTPIFGMGTQVSEEQCKVAQEMGMDGYLPRPIKVQDLDRVLKKYISGVVEIL